MAKVSKRFWFQLHGWFSLPVWVLFCFICITGTLSVVSHELTWLTNPAARASNPNNLPAKPIDELIAAVEQQHPTADITSVLVYEPYLVNAIIFTDHNKPQAIAYVNQYTGQIQAVNQGITFIGFMRALHGWLLFPWQSGYSVGYYLVSAMAIVMFGALATGLIIYKNFWRAFTQPKLRFNQGKKTLLKDLHSLAGVWSMWFLLIMSLTGFWYLTQAIMWHNEIDIEEHPPLVSVADLPTSKTVPAISLSQALQLTKQQFTDFEPHYIMFPEHSRGMYSISGSNNTIFYDDYAFSTTINPWTGELAQTKSPESMNALQTISHIADPLHYGTIGGIWTKLVWFIFGVILSGMSITGFMMWRSKLAKTTKAQLLTTDYIQEAQ
ncbi:PepSY domain-containing protein [Pseudoalteromonas sp. SR44-5]|uniref:PepSY-associated TM helix domain-containing protein n=1 Tax=Pseudoalteromonas TaxID=53246 RepID=UPI0015FF4292|nr:MULTISPECIES: PepSY-associated TM helix domain-containing protein [unclassified Pseudoalteromonas]MBB1333054.1 PepSY domain-containing protein [Pseudoalteromonas sp. SR41-6]MBB1340572.1 PepSY domain-containing protein [Pseudoalteromonas sp. SR45-6]MBB1364798.1 PepSY domain-containing protein [Pseudoalteromonas sp. SR44-5]MBB1433563.1 PepSY domain-containing protein [Pseudoalteromonas sp. SG43-6]MBB1457925.1 PepSY domain-containing protein [Pseudoalteromonas sp. SG41-8]